VIEENQKILREDRRSPGMYLNSGPSEYQVGVLTTSRRNLTPKLEVAWHRKEYFCEEGRLKFKTSYSRGKTAGE
jgi:hypothetical protein